MLCAYTRPRYQVDVYRTIVEKEARIDWKYI